MTQNNKLCTMPLLVALLFFTLISLSGCQDSQSAATPSPDPLSNTQAFNQNQRGELIAATLLSTIPTSATHLVIQYLVGIGAFDASLLNASTTYTVDNYKISYKTIGVNGDLINASGLLSVPVKTTGALSPIISYQHGTLFLENKAPSHNFSHTAEPVLMASLGSIISSADYIGYGDSAALPHPYSHSKTLASSSIDMLRAANIFLANQSIDTNGQLFLMGYSEGGKATLAMHREIQAHLASEFNVTAATVGSGNYDMRATTAFILNTTTLAFPAYVGWVIKSYNEIYTINRLADVIMPSFLSAIKSSYDGLKTGSEINALLTTQASALINPQFVSDYIGGREAAFQAAVADNDDYDWAPIAPLFLFHGRDDLTVPYLNTENAYNKMIQNGSTSVQIANCIVSPLPANHDNCFLPYINYTYGIIATYAQNL